MRGRPWPESRGQRVLLCGKVSSLAGAVPVMMGRKAKETSAGNAHVALQGVTRMATQAYYRGDGCPSAITFRPPSVNQRKRAAGAFAARLSSGEAIRAIVHRGYQHATAA